ncbi:MAG TPA: sigma-54-dependent Fis family transcriptional regulator [Methylibium sp.]|uniref:sigma-54-dependent Fis family transcriptional regulator n=1 Tax=Methylibium sp. TaxID=2067992 RepID=UPI002DBB407C|nr:sigma-54-dependent Fis family transcriptional regulator [Methylibium sp.]HEU4458316.1 sigma-54-dependent Fis family transcriptional regulator [Methylibium sp.]
MNSPPPRVPARDGRRSVGFGHAATSAWLPPDPGHVDAIQQSHERCTTLRISPIRAPDHSPMARADLSVARERNSRLSQHAVPVMEMLLEQILATQSMVLLTDVQGTVLHSIGHDDFLAKASKVALAPGVNWSESNKGTNAIGTALVTETPTIVHADEHFVHANHFLTCSASPVFDPRGNLVGVLDVTGDHHSFHAHTMGLVKMSARMIQNHWLIDDSRQTLRLHFHPRPEYLGTLMEGIVSVAPDGKLLGANRAALDLLRMSGAALRMNTLTGLFGTSVDALVDHFGSALALPLQLAVPDGRIVHLQARFSGHHWQAFAPGATGGGKVVPFEKRAEREDAPAPAEAPPAPVFAPAPASTPSLRQLQTGDARMDDVVARVKRVIDRDIAVLIQGETGAGKEVLARAIHQASRRAGQAFVAVNCASIPETLIESELFGYEEGAFTGARRKGAVGKVLQAHGGTLFLDEIGDMPLALQARLLRVLQEREVIPLGGTRALPVDVTIISATHQPLRDMIERRAFREDLYYRLNGLVVQLPALRDRSDLMVLAEKLLKRECRGQRLPRLDDEVVRLMQGFRWPGNVRQLANMLRTAVAMAGDASVITVEHLSEDFLLEARRAQPAAAASEPAPGAPAAATAPAPTQPPGKSVLQQLEHETVRRALAEAGGNISVAARKLGISRNTIYRKLYWPPGAGR